MEMETVNEEEARSENEETTSYIGLGVESTEITNEGLNEGESRLSVPSSPQPVESFINEITNEIFYRATKTVIPTKTTSALINTQEILETILRGTEHNIALKETYDIKCRSHNQYRLFKLLDIINDFEIDDELYEAMTFRECLIVNKVEMVLDDSPDGFHYETSAVGGMCIDVQKAEGKQPQERLMEKYEEQLLKLLDEEGICDHISGAHDLPEPSISEDTLQQQNEYGYSKFLVHVSSQFDFHGNNGGSSITSWVDRNCHTIEELRREFIMEGDNINEKSLYTGLKRRWYYVKHTASVESLDERKLYSIRKACDYVSEGANIILMRYLAIRRYYGKFQLSCAYINGNLCKNTYECFGPESNVFQGRRVDCCRIKRTVIEECGLVHECMTVVSLHGRILKQEWTGCDYVLQINPEIKLKNEKPSCLDEANFENSWVNDMQLMSNYLDYKQQCLMEAKTYDTDHPELRQLMADYVNQIVMLHPPDIKNFTFNYFGAFVSTHLPRNDYFE